MSMGLSTTSAEEVVNEYSEQKLKLIIQILGEEKEDNDGVVRFYLYIFSLFRRTLH